MTQKKYPKIIVLRKGIVSVVIFSTILILLLILHNLYGASRPSGLEKSESSTVHSIATTSDTDWYQNQSIQKNVVVEKIQPVKLRTQKNKMNFSASSQEQDDIMSQQAKKNLLKAMAAPITSNQLTETQQHMPMGSEMPASMMQNNPLASQTDQNMQGEKKSFLQGQATYASDYLESTLKDPISPYEVQAGTVIPGVLITGINSDLPGQIKGQVRSNVYDSISGKYVLIPQGSTLIGMYDSQVAYGQERVLVVWKRILFPNGQSINLEGMPGVDMSGYSGFNDQVNNHYNKIFGSVILMSLLSAGAQLSQPQNSGSPWQTPTIGQTMAQSLGTNLANTGTMMTAKNINIQPTLEIRQGYEFNISVTKDIIFSHPYPCRSRVFITND